jgi:hypothetical protein
MFFGTNKKKKQSAREQSDAYQNLLRDIQEREQIIQQNIAALSTPPVTTAPGKKVRMKIIKKVRMKIIYLYLQSL